MPIALPRQAINTYSKITDLAAYIKSVNSQVQPNEIDVCLNRVLCAAYISNEVTKGGIIKPMELVAEDIWQGKPALVLKVGPSAFKDTPDITFNGFMLHPGDWVTFKVGNASQIEINGYPCRIVMDHYIESRIPSPQWITS